MIAPDFLTTDGVSKITVSSSTTVADVGSYYITLTKTLASGAD
jgi:hypothetical protein